jgi:hypothetical protein
LPSFGSAAKFFALFEVMVGRQADGGSNAAQLTDSIFWGTTEEAWMRGPNTVAAIVNALRQVHGDDIARVMLNDGLSLAVLIDALLRSPVKTATRSN